MESRLSDTVMTSVRKTVILSATLKLLSRENISSSVKVLNLNAAVSSASSSSALLGMETMPPKVVR